MKKLLFAIIPVFFLSACTLIEIKQEVDSGIASEDTGIDTQVENLQEDLTALLPKFDKSNIVFKTDEELMEFSYIYEKALVYDDGHIGISIGGQDGYNVVLFYSKDGKVVKTSSPIFRYDIGYSNQNLYQYCIEVCNSNGCFKNQRTIDSVIGLDNCPLAKTINCVLSLETKDANQCVEKVLEYMFDLLNNNPSEYFGARLQDFKNSL